MFNFFVAVLNNELYKTNFPGNTDKFLLHSSCYYLYQGLFVTLNTTFFVIYDEPHCQNILLNTLSVVLFLKRQLNRT